MDFVMKDPIFKSNSNQKKISTKSGISKKLAHFNTGPIVP